jgi:hypothetical protein
MAHAADYVAYADCADCADNDNEDHPMKEEAEDAVALS